MLASVATASSRNGEQCDDGISNNDVTPDACRTTCVNAFCGDGVLDFAEECDDGNNSPLMPAIVLRLRGRQPGATCQEPLCPTVGEIILYAGTT